VHPQSTTTHRTANLRDDAAIEPTLALSWIDMLLQAPPHELKPSEFVTLVLWRAGLQRHVPEPRLRPRLVPLGHHLLTLVCREASRVEPGWFRAGGALPHVHPLGPALTDSRAKLKVPSDAELGRELWDALFAPTNLPGTASTSQTFCTRCT